MVAELIPQSEHTAWLTRADVIRADGAVMSWVNPAHPGYAYPEIAGYMLSYLAQHGRATVELRNRVARRLSQDMIASGAVGRNGVAYVFDSAMVLAGLIAHVRAGGLLPEADMLDRLHGYISSRLERRIGLEGPSEAPPDHWSASYGCHLLKCVIALSAYAELQPRDAQLELLDRLVNDLVPLAGEGRFRVNSLSGMTYTHAHCYAIEALLVLDGRGYPGLRPVIERGAQWLAQSQLATGGVPSAFDPQAAGPEHADCTAQAVRIWTCVDPVAYRPSIAQGAAFLNRLSYDGGIRYRAGSADINTWATIFAAQALDWADNGGRWEWII